MHQILIIYTKNSKIFYSYICNFLNYLNINFKLKENYSYKNHILQLFEIDKSIDLSFIIYYRNDFYAVMFFCYFYVFLMLFIIFFFNFLKRKNISYSNILLRLLEEKVNNFDDLNFIIFLSIFSYFLIYFNILNNFIYSPIPYIFYLLFFINVVVITFNLIFILYNFGFYFLAFIKGSSNKSSFFIEFIYDYLNLTAFFLRILVQSIRMFVVIIFLYLYDHILMDVYYTYYTYLPDKETEFFYFLFFKFLYFLFELIHFLIIFYIQVCSFLLMLLWLFQFLYTTSFKSNLEVNHIKN